MAKQILIITIFALQTTLGGFQFNQAHAGSEWMDECNDDEIRANNCYDYCVDSKENHDELWRKLQGTDGVIDPSWCLEGRTGGGGGCSTGDCNRGNRLPVGSSGGTATASKFPWGVAIGSFLVGGVVGALAMKYFSDKKDKDDDDDDENCYYRYLQNSPGSYYAPQFPPGLQPLDGVNYPGMTGGMNGYDQGGIWSWDNSSAPNILPYRSTYNNNNLADWNQFQ